MSLTATDELQLITDAQNGDDDAKLALLDEYRPNLRHIIAANPGYDADDLMSELTVAMLETINRFDPEKGDRLWPTFARAGKLKALEALSVSLYALDVPVRTAQLAREVIRKADTIGLEAAIAAEPDMSLSTYLEVVKHFGRIDVDTAPPAGFTLDRFGRLVQDTRRNDGADAFDAALAEAAWVGMTDRQAEVTKLKYAGVPDYVPGNPDSAVIPTDRNSYGLSDAEVSDLYSTPERLACGRALTSRTISREVAAGLAAGRAAIANYLAPDADTNAA